MEGIFKKYIVSNFQRKLFSIFAALAIWLFVNNSITSTRVFTRVPIRVVNLPVDTTIRGLMPNGVLERKLTLTITGTKDVIDRIDSQDFEVVIDASDKGTEWVVQLSKKNIVSLNPDIELMHNITYISHSEFLIHLSKLITEKIPIFVLPPKGESPEGYQFLDIWPQKLYQIVSGAEEDVKKLQEDGLEITFDLSNVSKDDLDALADSQEETCEEVSFLIPESWKKIRIPFLNNSLQLMNGQDAKQLRIDFLRKSMLQLQAPVPVRIYFPVSLLGKINPETLSLHSGGVLESHSDVMLVSSSLFVNDVSRLFLDIVQDRLEIVLVPEQRGKEYAFSWQVQFIEPNKLEDIYVESMLPFSQNSDPTKKMNTTKMNPKTATYQGMTSVNPLTRHHQLLREKYLRARFRGYMQKFQLLYGKDDPFEIDISVDSGKVYVNGLGALQPFVAEAEEQSWQTDKKNS